MRRAAPKAMTGAWLAIFLMSPLALAQAKRDGGNRICVFQQEGYLYTPVSDSDSAVPPPRASVAAKGAE